MRASTHWLCGTVRSHGESPKPGGPAHAGIARRGKNNSPRRQIGKSRRCGSLYSRVRHVRLRAGRNSAQSPPLSSLQEYGSVCSLSPSRSPGGRGSWPVRDSFDGTARIAPALLYIDRRPPGDGSSHREPRHARQRDGNASGHAQRSALLASSPSVRGISRNPVQAPRRADRGGTRHSHGRHKP